MGVSQNVKGECLKIIPFNVMESGLRFSVLNLYRIEDNIQLNSILNALIFIKFLDGVFVVWTCYICGMMLDMP